LPRKAFRILDSFIPLRMARKCKDVIESEDSASDESSTTYASAYDLSGLDQVLNLSQTSQLSVPDPTTVRRQDMSSGIDCL
jgi:hypothetical protein